jgi:hypothetical protein
VGLASPSSRASQLTSLVADSTPDLEDRSLTEHHAQKTLFILFKKHITIKRFEKFASLDLHVLVAESELTSRPSRYNPLFSYLF